MSENKQSCPTCHQTVNKRRVRLGRHHVEALYKVWMWLEDNNRSTAKMVEIRDLLTSVQYATFNEWRKFAPYVVSGKRGTYTFDLHYLAETFTGKKLCTEYQVDPIEGGYEMTAYGTIADAKNVQEFLDENQQYIAQYTDTAKVLEQASLL